ncbi:MAG: FeoB-associated Cys-rich membrane protein [Treponema sp.]|jgi:hypothetical protein|nr:FeoB-associated Cys-rich membrane protein [Treponema sp.]
MEFIQQNIGNIVVGVIVFGVLAFTAARLMINVRKGKGGCNCGNCSRCE